MIDWLVVVKDLWNKKHKWIILGGSVLTISVVVFVFLSIKKEEIRIIDTAPLEETLIVETTTTLKWFVDVKGEVNNPGVFEVEEGMRLKEVVEMAGGFTHEADDKAINLAQLVSDEMVIIIPNQLNSETPSLSSHYSGKINLNTATKEQLMTVKGIGEKKAEAIITFREQKRINKIEELKQIKGFSDKFIDSIREWIHV